ncbi:mechanosensitive ion channel family protein [Candidatus Saccharibacteria bacterium]|nr:mechanosensitive ion channel family protein [Candidatus Saccharibacteria bacterium]
MNNLWDSLWFRRIIWSVAAVFVAWLIYAIITKIFSRYMKHFGTRKSQKAQTYLRLVKSVLRYVLLVLVFFVILQINGINITSVVAGVGVLGAVFGLALQDSLKDIFRGFDILSDDYYKVGDVIRFGNYEGQVLAIGLKTTKLRDINSLNEVSIANRAIEHVEVLSKMINIDVPMPYELSKKKAEEVLGEMVEKISAIEAVEKCEYRGVNNFGDSAMKYHIKVFSAPVNRVQTRRDALSMIMEVLEERKIAVPYNQLDVHQK